MTNPFVYLASQSPRRRELLEQIGVGYRVLSVDVEETPRHGESPADFVRRLAREKAEHGRARLALDDVSPVLGADTAVVVDDRILGKPRDSAHASEMLELLSGRRHEVFTAVALAATSTAIRLSASRVWFRRLSADECAAYCASGEPLDKAGAYAIQGLGAVFVERLDGSYSGVMGLPLFETAELLAQAGVEVMP